MSPRVTAARQRPASPPERASLAADLLQPQSALGQTFSELLHHARRSHPSIDVAAASFAEHVASVLDLSASEPRREIAERHAGDLYLACACVLGASTALAAFDRQCLRTVKTRVRAIDTSPAELDEVRQTLRERLLVGRPGVPPRLARYSGKGALAGWVAVAARRIALCRVGRLSRERDGACAVLAAHVAPVAEGELPWTRSRHVEQFQRAVQTALESLEPREQMLVRLHVVQGRSLSCIAASYGVSQSTVSRWFERARRRLRRETTAWLSRVAGLDSLEIPSLARDLESHLAIDMSFVVAPIAA